jgi:hypothetical protein
MEIYNESARAREIVKELDEAIASITPGDQAFVQVTNQEYKIIAKFLKLEKSVFGWPKYKGITIIPKPRNLPRVMR